VNQSEPENLKSKPSPNVKKYNRIVQPKSKNKGIER